MAGEDVFPPGFCALHWKPASLTDNMRRILQDASIVFLDPDNGVGRTTERHAALAGGAAKTCFHRISVLSTGNRQAWTDNMRRILQDASIVFLDPDNGVGRTTERHAALAG